MANPPSQNPRYTPVYSMSITFLLAHYTTTGRLLMSVYFVSALVLPAKAIYMFLLLPYSMSTMVHGCVNSQPHCKYKCTLPSYLLCSTHATYSDQECYSSPSRELGTECSFRQVRYVDKNKRRVYAAHVELIYLLIRLDIY